MKIRSDGLARIRFFHNSTEKPQCHTHECSVAKHRQLFTYWREYFPLTKSINWTDDVKSGVARAREVRRATRRFWIICRRELKSKNAIDSIIISILLEAVQRCVSIWLNPFSLWHFIQQQQQQKSILGTQQGKRDTHTRIARPTICFVHSFIRLLFTHTNWILMPCHWMWYLSEHTSRINAHSYLCAHHFKLRKSKLYT